jgi:hypothetical protein
LSIIGEIREQMALAAVAGRQSVAHLDTASSELERATQMLTAVAAGSENPHIKVTWNAVAAARHAPGKIAQLVAGGTRDAVDWADSL